MLSLINKGYDGNSTISGLIQREQHLVEAVYEEDVGRPFQSCGVEHLD